MITFFSGSLSHTAYENISSVCINDVREDFFLGSAETFLINSVLNKGTLHLSGVQYVLASFFRFKGVICGYAVFMMAQRIMELTLGVKYFNEKRAIIGAIVMLFFLHQDYEHVADSTL